MTAFLLQFSILYHLEKNSTVAEEQPPRSLFLTCGHNCIHKV